MFNTQRMTKVRIVGPDTQLSTVVNVLHKLKCIHLLDHLKTDNLDIGVPLGESERISAVLVKIRSLLSSFQLKQYSHQQVSHVLSDIEQRVEDIVISYNALQEKLSEIKIKVQRKKAAIKQFQLLEALQLDKDALQSFKYLHIFIGSITNIDDLESDLIKITSGSTVTHTIVDGKQYVAVIVSSYITEKVQGILYKHGFVLYDFDDLYSCSEDVEKIPLSVHLLEKDIDQAQATIEKFVLEHNGFLVSAESFLHKEAEKTQAPLRFGATEHAFFIEGWLSASEYTALTSELEMATNNKVYIEAFVHTEGEKAPIILKNMFFVKPFEFFMHLYTLPSYKEIDPSFFMFFTFPFFFGIMLGDVGYGLVTFLLFALLWWKIPKARNILVAMMLCSIITIFFGFIFGEYFGFEHVGRETGTLLTQYGVPLHEEIIHGETVYSFPRILNRLHGEIAVMGNNLPSVLVIGAILGFVHINLGLLLGFINELGSHDFVHAFLAKISWYVLELGIAISVLSSISMLSLYWWVGIVVIIIAAIMLFLGEGVQGLVEIPAIMTNILSYMRLGAVGLASVGLAVVVNEKLVLPFMEQGGAMIVVAFFIFVLGHIINIALGVIGPFLHALRLHYVEFFSKFYHGGGIPFHAFGKEIEET